MCVFMYYNAVFLNIVTKQDEIEVSMSITFTINISKCNVKIGLSITWLCFQKIIGITIWIQKAKEV